MKTQGISLVTANTSDCTVSKTAKASESTFETFMTTHTSKVEQGASTKKADALSRKEDGSSVQETEKTTSVSDSNPAQKKNAENDAENNMDSNADKDVKVPDDSGYMQKESAIAEENELVMMVASLSEMLQNIFGLDSEQAQDIINQSEIDFSALFGSSTDPVSMEEMMQKLQQALQNLVMDVHGITDKAVFVTNDVLNQEFETLREQAVELFLGKEDGVQGTQEQSVQLTATDSLPTDGAGTAMEPEETFEVIVETDTESGESNDGSLPQQTEKTSSVRAEINPAHSADSAANVFTERLSEAFEDTRGEMVREPMSAIVEQVVRQVRIRVMPETTSMELMLHPASLGRVNLAVSTMANGVSTAVLTVENQMAKEALESQMIALKQSFDEQGLKVNAVEVTISDFGMSYENREAYQGQPNEQSGGRRFRSDTGESEVEDAEQAKETDETRRDVNSVVDYTA